MKLSPDPNKNLSKTWKQEFERMNQKCQKIFEELKKSKMRKGL